MEMHEKASRKHYTKYAESSNTSNKLYAEAVVNRSRICPKLNKAQSEVRTFMYYCTVRINMCNGCMIVLSSTIFLIMHTHQMDGHCCFLFLCQRIWRRYYVIKMVSEQLHEDWRLLMNEPNIDLTTQWISRKMLRPFLFFITQPSSWYKGQQSKTMESILTCFKIILNSINSKGMSSLVLLLFFDLSCS